MRTRRLLLAAGILAVAGTLGYVGYRKGWFFSDSENPAEVAKLGEKKLEVPPPAEAAAGSYRWRGPTGDGRAPAGPFRTDWDTNPPKLLWQTPCGGGYSSCAVVGGRVYTQDRPGRTEDRVTEDRVICLNAEDGKLLWEYRYGVDYTGIDHAAGPRATPTVEGKTLWAVGASGEMVSLLLPDETGRRVERSWSKHLAGEFQVPIPKWGFAGSPLIVGDVAVVQPGGKKGAVVGLDKYTGDVRWAGGSNPPGYSSPVLATIGGQPTIFAFLGDALLALRTDGTITDSYPWKTEHRGNIATPLVVDEYVFISSAYGMGWALLRAEKSGDGVKLIKVRERRGPRAMQNHHSTSVYKDRHLFGFHGMQDSARLKCLNIDTGEEKPGWDPVGMGSGSGTILLADKHLIIQTERGDLCLVEATAEEFRLIAKIPKVLSGNSNWATPVLVDGRLYLRDERNVVCLDVR